MHLLVVRLLCLALQQLLHIALKRDILHVRIELLAQYESQVPSALGGIIAPDAPRALVLQSPETLDDHGVRRTLVEKVLGVGDLVLQLGLRALEEALSVTSGQVVRRCG